MFLLEISKLESIPENRPRAESELEVFDDDEQGFGVVKQENVPKEAEEDCARAEANCPERAIHITP